MENPINHTRKSLAFSQMGFNQLRNSIYWLQRIMHQFRLSDEDIAHRLTQMGTNIGATFSKEYTASNPDIIKTLQELYHFTLNSSAKISQEGNIIIVQDRKCALCKYQYEDIHVPGCTIAVAMITEMLKTQNISIKNAEVTESRALGHEHCIHRYEIDQEEGFV